MERTENILALKSTNVNLHAVVLQLLIIILTLSNIFLVHLSCDEVF